MPDRVKAPPRPPSATRKGVLRQPAGRAKPDPVRGKKTAGLSRPGRITLNRPRTRTRVAPLRVFHRGFADVEAATEYLIGRGEELVRDGVLPRRPVELYLDALVPVLGFIHARQALFQEANLGPEVCGAVEHIAQELQAMPEGLQHPDPRGPADMAQAIKEATSTGALLLTAYRDAVRRVARGPKGLDARNDMAVGDVLDLHDPQQVADSIARFVSGAARHPAYVAEAGLSAKQLAGLAAQGRVIGARLKQQVERGAPTPKQVRMTQVLHAALEYFFDRFSAAVSAKLLDHPEERVRGLKLVPRDPTRRAGGLRSTDPR